MTKACGKLIALIIAEVLDDSHRELVHEAFGKASYGSLTSFEAICGIRCVLQALVAVPTLLKRTTSSEPQDALIFLPPSFCRHNGYDWCVYTYLCMMDVFYRASLAAVSHESTMLVVARSFL